MIDFKNGKTIKLSERDEKSAPDILPLLIPGEQIVSVYKSMRDHVVFTNKRIIAVNVQGMTGKKRDFTSLPYSKIQAFSVETAGIGDWDSELELWFSGLGIIKLDFTRESDIVSIGRLISEAILQDMSNEELLMEFELTAIAYAINADNKEADLSNTEEYLKKLKAEILKRMK